MLGEVSVILKMPLTMETAAALIQRQAENFFFFKAHDSLGEESQPHGNCPRAPASSSEPTMSIQ